MVQKHRSSRFPAGIFLGAVGLVCLGMAVSATYTYSTFMRLRTQYLQNLGNEIAVSLDLQARGPGRRNNPAFWQSLIEECYQAYSPKLAFVSLIDASGSSLASKEADPLSAPGYARFRGSEIYVYELPVSSPRFAQFGMSHQEASWRLRVGLYASVAESIRRQALIGLAVASAAIAMLFLLAVSFLRMLRRFLVLKASEGSERHLRALGTMAAALAHEIRNPLGAMKGLTQLVQEDLPRDHAAQASIKTVIGEAERLERLVSDLLDFARPRQIKFGRIDLARLFAEIAAMLKPRLDDDGVVLDLRAGSESLAIMADEDGLRQILINMLVNALEVSPRGSGISLAARHLPKSRELLLEIEDAGPGLGDSDPEALFQPFVTTKTRGTGLGLAISRQVAENMGGTLTLENLAQGGARCTLRLPQNAAS